MSFFVVRDKVLLHDKKFHTGPSSTLSQPWTGPYAVITVGDVAVMLELPRNKILRAYGNIMKFIFLIKITGQWNKNCGSSMCS